MNPGSYVVSAVRRTAAVPLDALRLLGRHWAALFTVIAIGLGLRALVIWGAVLVSDISALAAALIVPFAPIAVMTSLIFALWQMRPSLPYISAAIDDPTQGSLSVRLLTIGGLLIPFLTVYSAHGLLREDTRAYIHDAVLSETSRNLFNADFGRTNYDISWVLIALIALALVLRKIIGVFALGEKSVGWAGLSAYLEILWMVTFSVLFAGGVSWIREWVSSRAVIAPLIDAWDSFTAWALEVSGPLGALLSWLVTVVTKADDVIIIPVAWLTLGATIYGTTLVAQSVTPAAPAGETSTQRRHRLDAVARAEARKALDEAAQPLLGPVKSTLNSLGKIAAAGLGPMVMFCLLFTLAKGSELLVLYAGRVIVGPQDMWASAAIDPYILVLARLVYLVAAVVFIAPAIDRLLRASAEASAQNSSVEVGWGNATGSGASSSPVNSR